MVPISLYFRRPVYLVRSRFRCCGSIGTGHSQNDSDSPISISSHIQGKDSQIDPYWFSKLEQCEKPSSRKLIEKLIDSNALGFDYAVKTGSSETLVKYVIQEKIKHPTKIILVKVGEFYESYGVGKYLQFYFLC